MSAQHTPGPWRTCPRETRALGMSILQADGRVVARTRTAWGDGYVAENEANARLIAAAPCLLKALREARAVVRMSSAEDDEQINAAIRKVEALCDAAIAKATGGAP